MLETRKSLNDVHGFVTIYVIEWKSLNGKWGHYWDNSCLAANSFVEAMEKKEKIYKILWLL